MSAARFSRAFLCASLFTCLHITAIAAEPAAPSPNWTKVAQDATGRRDGAVLVWAPDIKRFLLMGVFERDGGTSGPPLVQAFDPEAKRWESFTDNRPFQIGQDNFYKQPTFTNQVAYDGPTKSVYCLSHGNVLYVLDVEKKSWRSLPPAPELVGLAWPTLACDPESRKLVVVGAEKQGEKLGWSRTVILDLETGRWSRLTVDEAVESRHQQLLAAIEKISQLAGRLRMAWYRDPGGAGDKQTLTQLAASASLLTKEPGLDTDAPALHEIAQRISAAELLPALKAAKALRQQLEQRADAEYLVPSSRRNSPLVFDVKNKVFVLFGGDHQDYQLNDTWVLDLKTKSWKRMEPQTAPSPRAGHALVYLPQRGEIALYEGYVASNDTSYASSGYEPITPTQLWLYNVKQNRWRLAGSWAKPAKDETDGIAPVGYFYGGEGNNRFSPPPLAADDRDELVLAGPDTHDRYGIRYKRPGTTWMLTVSEGSPIDEQEKLAVSPNQRHYRVAEFRPEFCEVADAPKATNLDSLPANRWVKLPDAPRNPAQGCRGRDWSTSVWDSDRDEILLWGGGHCVRSSSPVLHYSPVSGRMVEGYDAEESYGGNSPADNSLEYDSTLLGRPWVAVHNYKHYAYDPKCKLLVSARGYLYDPEVMDWRRKRYELPFNFGWGSTVVASSKHGAVAWTKIPNTDDAGLWVFDIDQGWQALKPAGEKMPIPWCDTHGMVYDSKRDRMLLTGIGGGYDKNSDGSFLAFDFATNKLTSVMPTHAELGQTNLPLREVAYAEHADSVLLGSILRVGDEKTGKGYTRIYDCAANRMQLLDTGPIPPDGHEAGWMYDAKRKLVYAFSTHAEAWALRLEPSEAKFLDKAP